MTTMTMMFRIVAVRSASLVRFVLSPPKSHSNVENVDVSVRATANRAEEHKNVATVHKATLTLQDVVIKKMAFSLGNQNAWTFSAVAAEHYGGWRFGHSFECCEGWYCWGRTWMKGKSSLIHEFSHQCLVTTLIVSRMQQTAEVRCTFISVNLTHTNVIKDSIRKHGYVCGAVFLQFL